MSSVRDGGDRARTKRKNTNSCVAVLDQEDKRAAQADAAERCGLPVDSRRCRNGAEAAPTCTVAQPLTDYRLQSLLVDRRLVRKNSADCYAILTVSYRTAHETPD